MWFGGLRLFSFTRPLLPSQICSYEKWKSHKKAFFPGLPPISAFPSPCLPSVPGTVQQGRTDHSLKETWRQWPSRFYPLWEPVMLHQWTLVASPVRWARGASRTHSKGVLLGVSQRDLAALRAVDHTSSPEGPWRLGKGEPVWPWARNFTIWITKRVWTLQFTPDLSTSCFLVLKLAHWGHFPWPYWLLKTAVFVTSDLSNPRITDLKVAANFLILSML